MNSPKIARASGIHHHGRLVEDPVLVPVPVLAVPVAGVAVGAEVDGVSHKSPVQPTRQDTHLVAVLLSWLHSALTQCCGTSQELVHVDPQKPLMHSVHSISSPLFRLHRALAQFAGVVHELSQVDPQ